LLTALAGASTLIVLAIPTSACADTTLLGTPSALPFSEASGPAGPHDIARPSRADRQRITRAYQRLPLAFDANNGQAAPRTRFLAQGPGYSLGLTRRGMHLALTRATGRRNRSRTDELSLSLVGSRHASLSASRRLPGTSNYLIGADRSRWATGVRSFQRVTYRHPWAGIDALLSGGQAALRYDFLVHPGAHPDRIAVGVRGARALHLDRHGHLVMTLGDKRIVQARPVAYQRAGGERHRVGARYVLDGRTLGIRLGHYDHARPLLIDPTLNYSTYLGGSGVDEGRGIAVDSAGNAYVTGSTASNPFPTSGAIQSSYGGGGDAFVAKFDPSASGASSLVYSTYLGGSSEELARGIAVDSAGSAYVIGYTGSANFPKTTGAFDESFGGIRDAFVAKLNPAGSALSYSTYLGDTGQDEGDGIAVDSAGSAYVTGTTSSSGFPVTAGAFQVTKASGAGGFDGFVTKLNTAGSALTYSTYLGGASLDEGFGIALDTAGNAEVAGETFSIDFPTTVGAFQTVNAGDSDVFAAKLNTTGTALVYSTYLGGSGSDIGRGVAVDSAGSAYITGATGSADFPTTLGAFQDGNAGGNDAFLTKLNATGTGPSYSTYLGGSSGDQGNGIAVDSAGTAYVTGAAGSANFPTTPGAFQTANAGGPGGVDAFVTKLDPSASGASSLGYSTYLGGSGEDHGDGIAVDAAGSVYVTGYTNTANFPTTAGAFQPTAAGFDAFVAMLGRASPTLMTNASPGVAAGGEIHDTATIAGGFNPTGQITFDLYGPNDSNCSGTPAFTDSKPVSGNGSYDSLSFAPAQAGVYRWTASYSGDSDNNPAVTACNDANESVTVSPANPSLATNASAGVVVGGQIHDTATLAAGFNPTGQITFNLYVPDDSSCSGPPAFMDTKSVSGNASYDSLSFTPTQAGVYRWTASYSGDANNNAVSSACNAVDESVTVSQAPPTLTTSASPDIALGGSVHDTATLAGGSSPTGEIAFKLYGPDDSLCSGSPVFTDTKAVSGNGDYQSADITPTAPGTYRWTASYSGDSNNNNASTACNEGSESVAVQRPELGDFRLDPERFAVAKGNTPIGPPLPKAAKTPRGSTIELTLNAAALVHFRVERQRAQPPPPSSRKRRGFNRDLDAGPNSIPFTGRLYGRALRPGHYLLFARPIGDAGRTYPRLSAPFVIVAG